MRFRMLASMISTSNDYSLLKWPLLIFSVLITFLALILLISFQSESWFTYESFDMSEKFIPPNSTVTRYRSVEYGSFGLWDFCTTHHKDDSSLTCDLWTRRTRPEFFNVILFLTSSALFLINLTVFPSWAATIFVLYNINNRYTRYILIFLWILFCLSFLFTILLITSMVLLGLSKFYSPGKYYIDSQYLSFHTSTGIFLLFSGTIISIICFILLIVSLIWKKFIEIQLTEEDKRLYQQLTADENLPINWHQVIRVPRRPSATSNFDDEPPPYPSYRERT